MRLGTGLLDEWFLGPPKSFHIMGLPAYSSALSGTFAGAIPALFVFSTANAFITGSIYRSTMIASGKHPFPESKGPDMTSKVH
jgi:hypothetical protein